MHVVVLWGEISQNSKIAMFNRKNIYIYNRNIYIYIHTHKSNSEWESPISISVQKMCIYLHIPSYLLSLLPGVLLIPVPEFCFWCFVAAMIFLWRQRSAMFMESVVPQFAKLVCKCLYIGWLIPVRISIGYVSGKWERFCSSTCRLTSYDPSNKSHQVISWSLWYMDTT